MRVFFLRRRFTVTLDAAPSIPSPRSLPRVGPLPSVEGSDVAALLAEQAELLLRDAIGEEEQEAILARFERAPSPARNGVDVLRAERKAGLADRDGAASFGNRHH